MTQEQEIAELLAEAEPLRALDEDHPDKAKLGPIVDRINALRNPRPKPLPPPDIDPEVETVKANLPQRLVRLRKVV